MTGQVLFYKTNTKLDQDSDGGQSTTDVTYEFEEELVEGGANPVNQRVCSSPATIDQVFANVQCWFMTMIVVTQSLLPGVTFRLSPQTTLAYLQTLHYVSTYQGLTLDRFLTYHNESLHEIIQTYNKDDTGGSLDPVLKVSIGTLNTGMMTWSTFANSFLVSLPSTRRPLLLLPALAATSQRSSMKRSSLRTSTRLSVSLCSRNRLSISKPGFLATVPAIDRDRDQDRGRDSLSRKRPQSVSNDSKTLEPVG